MIVKIIFFLALARSCCSWSPSSPQNAGLTSIQQLEVDRVGLFFKTSSLLLGIPLLVAHADSAAEGISNIAVSYDGVSKPIGSYLGQKGTLIVNVASQCALTPQYEDLVSLYNNYNKMGFTVLGFPCNQFGSQEPENDIKKIRSDMKNRFGVEFPLFDKIEVNGGNQAPLYTKLKSYDGIGTSSNIAKISWNFEKFIIDGNGVPIRRYKPGVEPSQITGDIDELIKTGKLPPKKKPTLNDF